MIGNPILLLLVVGPMAAAVIGYLIGRANTHYIFPFPMYEQLPVLSLTEISHNRYHFPAMPVQPLWKAQN